MDQKDKQIEELKLQIEDLSKRLYEANEANTAKETFLANMSHDIRTPMNAIVGVTSLAKKYIDEKPRVIDALNKIDAVSTHLLSLINDILDMSRINSGKMEISMDEFSLRRSTTNSTQINKDAEYTKTKTERRAKAFRSVVSICTDIGVLFALDATFRSYRRVLCRPPL